MINKGVILKLHGIQILPSHVYLALRKLWYWPGDVLDYITGRRNPLTPPRRLAFIYGFDPEFKILGDQFLHHFIQLGKLKPDHRVLDIGCGVGRLALALTDYLSPSGVYRGFDLIPEGVRWCQRQITPRYPNFEFELADIHNATYHPRGRLSAEQFRFPYEDESFDFIFTKSVYTHMRPAAIEQYLKETARVLKPGGRCLNTFFLLTPEARQLMEKGLSMFDFCFEGPGYYTASQAEPEKAIAFDEHWVRDIHRRCGLDIIPPLHYGSWSGRTDECLSGQDIVLATKHI